jgi:ribose 5-phosphate isomerase B
VKIFIGADHRGYELKEKVFQFLVDKGYDIEDLGAYEYDPKDDFTGFGEKVALMVRDNPESVGVLLCGSGVGVDVIANKFDGIRASIGKSVDQIRAGRSDDDMNVLVIASDYTEEKDALDMVEVFLKTEFSGKSRFKRRLDEIKRLEENN